MQCKQLGEVERWLKWWQLDTWFSGGLADTNDAEYCVEWDENSLFQKILHKWVSSQLIFWWATDSPGFKILFPAKYLFLLLNSMPWILSQAGREQMSSSEVCGTWQRQVSVYKGPMASNAEGTHGQRWPGFQAGGEEGTRSLSRVRSLPFQTLFLFQINNVINHNC